MRRIIKINECDLHNLVNESVKHILNEMSYDDWKLMTPEEDVNLKGYDVEITIRVLVDNANLNLWRDCKKYNVNQIDDGLTEFLTTFTDEVWVSGYCRDRDSFDVELRGQCEECTSDFVNERDKNAEYEMLDYKTI